MTVIVLILIVGICAIAWILWPRRDDHPSRKISHPPLFEELDDGGWSARLADGSEYRCEDKFATVWFHFPSGHRAELMLEFWIDDQLDAHKNRMKWTK